MRIVRDKRDIKKKKKDRMRAHTYVHTHARARPGEIKRFIVKFRVRHLAITGNIKYDIAIESGARVALVI